jgi:hypothetical protein
MTSREECEKAYLYLLKHCYEATKKNDTYDFAPSGFKESEVFKQLIEEHFELAENTEEYKHFKLHSASTLKNQTKEELIDYIKMLYHNWGVCDEQLKRIIDKAKELSDSNNKLERTVCSLDYALSDVYNPKPYKFEELKPNMWVWDNVAKECLYVVRPFITTGVRVKYFTCLGIWNLEKIKKLNMKFEENRFFPVQCANYLGGI